MPLKVTLAVEFAASDMEAGPFAVAEVTPCRFTVPTPIAVESEHSPNWSRGRWRCTPAWFHQPPPLRLNRNKMQRLGHQRR